MIWCVVHHAGDVLRATVLAGEVAQELHLEGLEVVAAVLVLIVRAHLLLLVHTTIIAWLAVVAVVEKALQVLGQLHLVVHLIHLLTIVLLL